MVVIYFRFHLSNIFCDIYMRLELPARGRIGKLIFPVHPSLCGREKWRSSEMDSRATRRHCSRPGQSKAKAKRSEAKGGNLTADGWPWLYSTQPALGPAQRVNVERSLTPRLASLLYTWAPRFLGGRVSLPSYPLECRPLTARHPVYKRASWYFDARRALWPPQFDFLPIYVNFYLDREFAMREKMRKR